MRPFNQVAHSDMPGVKLARIVSGCQTGVDRGALDAALSLDFPAGGWCPSDRSAEDGPIPSRYPVVSLKRGGCRARTLQNVIDSDATVILAPGTLTGGTHLTLELCHSKQKSVLVIDAVQFTEADASVQIARFIQQHSVRVLNVAGPRASGWPAGHAYSEQTIRVLLTALAVSINPCAWHWVTLL